MRPAFDSNRLFQTAAFCQPTSVAAGGVHFFPKLRRSADAKIAWLADIQIASERWHDQLEKNWA